MEKDERLLTGTVLKQHKMTPKILETIQGDLFLNSIYRNIFKVVKQDFDNGLTPNIDNWCCVLSDNEIGAAKNLFKGNYQDTPEEIIMQAIKNIKQDFIKSAVSARSSYEASNQYLWYLRLIYQFKVLSSWEESELFKRMKSGDLNAKKKIIESNLRLVAFFARRYIKSGIPIMDLIQTGNIGLIMAVDKFDYTRGNKFSTYATWWIKQSIMRTIANESRLIRIPVHMVESINRIERAVKELMQELGREPLYKEIAKRADIPIDKIPKYLKLLQQPLSLSMPVNDKGKSRLEDFIEDSYSSTCEEEMMNTYYCEQVKEMLSILSKREREIIKFRFGLDEGYPHTLEEVATVFGITRERIRQIESKTKAKLQKYLTKMEGKIDKWDTSKLSRGDNTAKEKGEYSYKIEPIKGIFPSWEYKILNAEVIDKIYNLNEELEQDENLTEDNFEEIESEKLEEEINTQETELEDELEYKTESRFERKYTEKLHIALRYVLKRVQRPLYVNELAVKFEKEFEFPISLNEVYEITSLYKKEFAWAGSGTYALPEWGYPGYVRSIKEVIAWFINENGRAVTEEEIYEFMLPLYNVKKVSIINSLRKYENTYFKHIGRKLWGLNKGGRYE